ncbi:phosphate ABC transporter substrate-binding protein PstS family protein [Halorhodospira halochloris]|uniref:PstS family phosphate ABC transporter substrate-binding protein n=1 Tax=Halorhodospira halochloris TaxID=1052 RepID=UPI001EE9AD2E|nr:phosphate ABC transporter substrate-binding protein PstS family protein [Halorhodospira halochloris]MCG5530132.1 phosphate ABC transporter substrate-binding protein PstS family protein [Halorhodospira halochloris]
MLKRSLLVGITSAALLASGHAIAVDDDLPRYERVSGISGNLGSMGSDTLNNLMTLWAEEFNDFYPNVSIEIEGAGSGTAPVALSEGTANFGPMSRSMRSSEIQDFEDSHGYEPTKVRVAIDTIAVFVNRDNPIEGLTLDQVDGIFSETQRCGGYNKTRWGDVGLDGAWSNRDFTLYSRNAVSGTYGFFREHALCDGDFKDAINEQPGSASVVQGVSESLNGIGYSGIGYKTSGVRAIPLGEEEGEYYEPTGENAVSGNYPLARFLYVYVNKHPNDGLPPLEREFLRLVLSKEGQEVVNRDGFIPLPAAAAQREKERLGL